MKTDIEIAQEAKMKPITQIAAQLGLEDESVIPYGRYKAKIDHRLIHNAKKQGKLILVTAISPTPAGEGKTTTSVGLADAMNALGKKTMLCLREPSLGPVFGVGGDFPRGHQVEYVLGEWSDEERTALPERLKVFVDAIRSFATVGTQLTMNYFNKK